MRKKILRLNIKNNKDEIIKLKNENSKLKNNIEEIDKEKENKFYKMLIILYQIEKNQIIKIIIANYI